MSSAPSIRRRVHFIDLARLLASLQMVNGHTLDALMAESIREGVWFDRYTWVRGLVSVAFLTVAGVAFYLATLARFEVHRSDPQAVRRRFRRAALLVFLGYLLKFPGAAFGDDPARAARALDYLGEVGVLQTIGVTLFCLEAMTVLARRPQQVVWGCAVLATLALVIAPLADRIVPAGPLEFVANYLTHRGGSLFPLLPWSGYMFAGVALGAWSLPSGSQTPLRNAIPRLMWFAASVATVHLVAAFGPWTLQPGDAHPATAPSFVLLKFAVVLTGLAILAVLSRPIRSLPRLLRVLATEALTIYVFHLVILYAGGVGLARLWGHSLTLPQAAVVSACMIAATTTYAATWHAFKKGAFRRSAVTYEEPQAKRV